MYAAVSTAFCCVHLHPLVIHCHADVGHTKAAEQRFANAQYNLALMYAFGRGVPQDNVYAHMWFNLAAVDGDEDASRNRDNIAKRMTTAEISKAQSLARE